MRRSSFLTLLSFATAKAFNKEMNSVKTRKTKKKKKGVERKFLALFLNFVWSIVFLVR